MTNFGDSDPHVEKMGCDEVFLHQCRLVCRLFLAYFLIPQDSDDHWEDVFLCGKRLEVSFISMPDSEGIRSCAADPSHNSRPDWSR